MKTSRIPVMPQSAPKPFGLFAIIESKRVVLPLKGVECDFSVLASLVEVSMTQIFRQENEKPLNCEYLFPLPADASVYSCEADINGRTIRAQVREREEARKIAAEKQAAGFRTALVEAERENLFTLSLGNVQPGDLVIIQVKYFQTIRSLAGQPSLEIPLCPGIRYIPGRPLLRSNKGKGVVDDSDQVPDASRITPVRIDAEHPDAAYIDVRGTLDGRFVNEQALASPSHPIVVQKAGEDLRVSLSDKGDVPDRDFVLRWSERNVKAVASRAWIQAKGNETYALLEIRAPEDAPAERAPVDFYFLVDRSGSMRGEKWNKAAEALQSCMGVLGPDDRAMVTFFESSCQDFAERPLSVRDLLEDGQFQRVKQLGTAGGTELAPALRHVLDEAAKYSRDRCKNLILITDAQIGNESAILELMKESRDFPVHCFGIDVALNDSLLLALSHQQGGTFHSLHPSDDIERAVTSLGKTLGQPVLLDLKVPEGWELAEAAIPNLYAGQIHYLSARSSARSPALELTARTGAAEPVTIRFETQTAATGAAYLHWSRARMRRLMAEGKDGAAVALSVESNLVCPLTAFIAWDESEKVPIATQDLVQPSLEPAGAADYQIGSLRSMAPSAPRSLASFSRAFPRGQDAGLFREFLQVDASLAMPTLCEKIVSGEAIAPDELDLKRELSEICHQAGVSEWRRLVKVIFDWLAEVSGADRRQRVEAVSRLLEEIKARVARTERSGAARTQREIDELRDQIHELLKKFVDGLPAKKS
ncbi:MAG TPA: VIT and VWA domain-containing protein [Verrucomicrobiae bacterium]